MITVYFTVSSIYFKMLYAALNDIFNNVYLKTHSALNFHSPITNPYLSNPVIFIKLDNWLIIFQTSDENVYCFKIKLMRSVDIYQT